ncbi:MAG: exopolysaccharide production protein ExoQ [Pseudoalteromonas tetraodonis]|jgi:exopolysaccharide production protein ExoQ|uniref:O-antigen ligase family protein n=1 Tax=Pseudoalteromonas tetraodonis TaxID=43659 RepID=UPI00398A0091
MYKQLIKKINSNQTFMFSLLFFSFFLHLQLRTPLNGILLYILLSLFSALLLVNVKNIKQSFQQNSSLNYLLLLNFWAFLSIFWSETSALSLYRFYYQILMLLSVAYILHSLNYKKREKVLLVFFYVLLVIDLFVIAFIPSLGQMGNGISGLHYHKNQLGGILAIISVVFYFSSQSTIKKKSFSLILIAVCFLIGAKTAFFTASICILMPLILKHLMFYFKFNSLLYVVKCLSILLLFIVFILVPFYIENILDFFVYDLPPEILTGRGAIWSLALSSLDSFYVGEGFSSFWQVDESVSVVAANAIDNETMWFLKIEQAHNGYIDMLLSLGAVGVFLLMLLIYKSLINSLIAFRYGNLLPLSIWLLTILFNFTETSFMYYFSPTWFVFLLYTVPAYEKLDKDNSDV